MSRLWSIVTFGRCVWARKSRDIQFGIRRHTLATCCCWDRGRLFSLYRILCWFQGYFVSLAMGCVVVTEPFDLTSLVEDTRSLFQFGCTPIFASIFAPTQVGTLLTCCRQGHVCGNNGRHRPISWARFDSRPCCYDWSQPYDSWRCRVPQSHFCVSICARDANVVRYAKGHVYSKITPHTPQTTILHGCFQEAYVDWVGRSFFVFEHRCLRWFALAVERHPLFINVQFLGQPAEMTCGVFIAAIGSYRGRKVVRRSASCVLFDCDVFKFVTSRDAFQVCTGVTTIAKTRGMRSCICHDLCHVVWKHYHWTNKVCV